MSKIVRISPEIEERIAALYRSEDQETVRAMLLEVEWPERVRYDILRIRYDILHVAAGDLARVRSLVDLAKRDPRDVMCHEYFWEDGISKPHAWALVHEVNRKLPAEIDAGEVKPYQPARPPRRRSADPND